MKHQTQIREPNKNAKQVFYKKKLTYFDKYTAEYNVYEV